MTEKSQGTAEEEIEAELSRLNAGLVTLAEINSGVVSLHDRENYILGIRNALRIFKAANIERVKKLKEQIEQKIDEFSWLAKAYPESIRDLKRSIEVIVKAALEGESK